MYHTQTQPVLLEPPPPGGNSTHSIRRKRNPERGEEGERGEAEGEEKGGQAKDDRTDIKGTPKIQRARATTTPSPSNNL